MAARAQLDATREELIALVAECGYVEAARRLDVAVSTVHKRVTDMGLRDEVAALAQELRRPRQVPMTADAARRALPGTSGVYREALQARVDHPHDSLIKIAAKIGWNPNTYTTRLRRALIGATPRRSTLGKQRPVP